MNTPIVDFINNYKNSKVSRMHMPGHKGAAFLGFEEMDITEIKGADSLYHADGIIAESEANATELFKTGKTIYSAEGSSLSIKTMLYLALLSWKENVSNTNLRPVILATRNVHISFVHAAALLDFDVKWLWPANENRNNILSCDIDLQELSKAIEELADRLVAVYITSPDYLGNVANIKSIADICHNKNKLLLVDNAHGAYLRFLDNEKYPDYQHPIVQGADICSDSAHKTLPVLTGGAYLHMAESFALKDKAKFAMNIFASTSPSYLILASLDKCNEYLADSYAEKLANFCHKIEKVKEVLDLYGYKIVKSDPLKITLQVNDANKLADNLRKFGIECEYSDEDFLVLMLTPENVNKNGEEDIYKLLDVLARFNTEEVISINKKEIEKEIEEDITPIQRKSIREATMLPSERLKVNDSLGRICASPLVSCPPAVPIIVSGEEINEAAIKLFKKYKIEYVECLKQ